MKREIVINMIIMSLVMILIILVLVVMLNSMENKFTKECAKQDYQGIISYWDVDVDCSVMRGIKDITTVNESYGEES